MVVKLISVHSTLMEIDRDKTEDRVMVAIAAHYGLHMFTLE